MGINKPQKGISTKPCAKAVDYEISRLDRFLDKTPLKENPRSGGIHINRRKSCELQVYSTTKSAQNAIRSFAKLGIRVKIMRCKACGLIHLEELRG
jgi:hypothetical protein